MAPAWSGPRGLGIGNNPGSTLMIRSEDRGLPG
jgi:hypothetical protein